MRREILCSDCNTERIKRLGVPIIDTENGPRVAVSIGPIEHHGSVDGLAIKDCYCDSCGQEIKKGQKAIAVTTWIEGQKYISWEREYLTY